jgi:aubergine-like protein
LGFLQPYNDKSYVVKEIRYNETPMGTFQHHEGPVSFVQYYKQRHGIEIKDLTQPLLYSVPTPTGVQGRDSHRVALIPELCQLAGIQDDLRANFNAMKVRLYFFAMKLKSP